MPPHNLADFVKAYDVRGLVPEQLDVDVAWALGAAFAEVVVRREGGTRAASSGTTCAPSSPELSRAFGAGVTSRGVDVTHIGLASTDGLYFASGHLGLAGAMFTASHNPAAYNGIKLCRPGARPVGQDSGLADVRDLAQELLDGTGGAARTRTTGTSDRARPARRLRRLPARPRRPLRHPPAHASSSTPATAWAATPSRPSSRPAAGLPALPLDRRPALLRARRHLPQPRGQPARAREPARPPGRGRRARRRPRARLRRRRRPLLRRRRARRAGQPQRHHRPHRDPRGRPRGGRRHPGRARWRSSTTSSPPRRSPRSSPSSAPGPSAPGSATRSSRPRWPATDAVFGGEHSAHYYFRDFWFADTGMLAAMHVLAALGEQRAAAERAHGRLRGIRRVRRDQLDRRRTRPRSTDAVRAWARGQGRRGRRARRADR